MAPAPIYVDLPPYEVLNINKPAKKKAAAGLDLVVDIEKALNGFAKKNSSASTSLKDLLTFFFTDNEVGNNIFY